MIKYVKGDAVEAFLNGDVDILLHCCNAQGVMGSGIAKQIKDKIPSAFHTYKLSGYELGTISYAELANPRRYVCNMVAQEYYGGGKRHVHYGMLIRCLNQVLSELRPCKAKIAIPYKMCSDRAGGDWDTVLEIVGEILGRNNTIIVYNL